MLLELDCRHSRRRRGGIFWTTRFGNLTLAVKTLFRLRQRRQMRSVSKITMLDFCTEQLSTFYAHVRYIHFYLFDLDRTSTLITPCAEFRWHKSRRRQIRSIGPILTTLKISSWVSYTTRSNWKKHRLV